jgi:23S rRNA pseudouridine1911/1915/1917 synthase
LFKDSNWHEETRRLGIPILEDEVGRRLDDYLAQKFPFFSRSGWQSEIDNGVVLVNGIRAKKAAQRLRLGDELRRVHPFNEEPDVDTNMKVIWSDGELAAVYKPAGLPMHEAGFFRRRTVAGVLPQVLGEGWTPVHRLDRETSGLLLCARQPEIRALLTEMWTNKKVQKTYLAMTAGIPKESQWIVDLPIKSERFLRTNRAEISDEGGEALTAYKVLSQSKEGALLEAKPLTGRTNQIRLHASAIGLPLIGDKVYGMDPSILELYRKEGNSEQVQKMAGFPRHALHSWKLKLHHPINDQEIELQCPLPSDLIMLCANRSLSIPVEALDPSNLDPKLF